MAKIAASLVCIASTLVFGAAKNASPMRLPGYKAVPVYYEPLNKMIMPVRINGQPAKLLVDTGATQVILNRDAAELAGVKPLQRSLGQVRFLVPNQVFTLGSEINGEVLPVGFAQDITAGTMNFGSRPVALRDSNRPNIFRRRRCRPHRRLQRPSRNAESPRLQDRATLGLYLSHRMSPTYGTAGNFLLS
jgi:hypothetical protein